MSEAGPRGVVVFTFGMPDFSGANRMAFQYMLALRERGVEVAAICGDLAGDSGSVEEQLVREKILHRTFPGWNGLMNRSLVARVRTFLRETGAGAVASFLQMDVKIAGWAARAERIPFVVCAQNTVTFGGGPLLRCLKHLAFRHTITRCASRVFCCSESVRREYATRFRIPARLLSVLPNRIDLRNFPPQTEEDRLALRRSLGILPGERMLVNVGRIDPQKGQDLFLDSLEGLDMERLRASVFFVGGSSASDPGEGFYPGILARVRSNPRVHLLGWREDVPAVLSAGDLYVHPSRWEGLPLAVLEAMASGLPVIYSDCAGTIEGFENGVHGYCVPANDTGALRRALQRMLALPDSRLKEMGVSGRLLVGQKHDFPLSAEIFCDDLARLLKLPQATSSR